MQPEFIQILEQSFLLRRAQNQSYSRNAFARDLGIYPSQLSEVFKGRKGLSEDAARKLSKKLKLSEKEERVFILSVKAKHSRLPEVRKSAEKNLQVMSGSEFELPKHEYQIVADWLHFAVMELLRIRPTATATDLTSYFAVEISRVRKVIENLTQAKLIKKQGSGFRVVDSTVFAPRGIPSPAKRLHHLKLLKVASGAYLKQDFDQRDFMSQIISVDSKRIKEAKKLINEFHKRMNSLLSSDRTKKSAVYVFSTQLYSLHQGGRYE